MLNSGSIDKDEFDGEILHRIEVISNPLFEVVSYKKVTVTRFAKVTVTCIFSKTCVSAFE